MPLPFAPKPEESKVYQSLKSTLLSSVTPDQLDQLRSEVFAQGTDGSEDEYRRLILLGAASQATSFSGPLPQTVEIPTVTLGSTGTGGAETVKLPGENEVWQYLGGALESVTVASGTPNYYVELYDGTNAVQVTRSAMTLAGAVPLLNEFGLGEGGQPAMPIYFTKDVYLRCWFTGTVSADPVLNFAVVRVR